MQPVQELLENVTATSIFTDASLLGSAIWTQWPVLHYMR
jgi:hypothetical protein